MLRSKEISTTIGLILFIFVLGCNSKNKSADIYSYQFQSKSKKIEKLREYLTKESGLIDAEYHIWYQDNGSERFVPGPSDYNIKIALKINPDSINSWIAHLQPSSKHISNNKWNDLKLDLKDWKLKSKPELYHSNSMTEVKLLYRKENIILGIYSTMPIDLDYLNKQEN